MAVIINSEEEMLKFGAELAAKTQPPCVIFLQGELGAGKTTLVRGFLRALGHKGAVKSPTYTLVEPYELAGKKIYHFDLYRLVDSEELEYIGIRDYFKEKAICFIEWPERGLNMLPKANITYKIEVLNDGRKITIQNND